MMQKVWAYTGYIYGLTIFISLGVAIMIHVLGWFIRKFSSKNQDNQE